MGLIVTPLDWQPLEKVAPMKYCQEFMFMGQGQLIRTPIFLYKHIISRQYLNLDKAGNFYQYQASEKTYRLMTAAEIALHIQKKFPFIRYPQGRYEP